MDVSEIIPYLPLISGIAIGLLGGWYLKFKRIVKALDKAMEDDSISVDEWKALSKLIKK